MLSPHAHPHHVLLTPNQAHRQPILQAHLSPILQLRFYENPYPNPWVGSLLPPLS